VAPQLTDLSRIRHPFTGATRLRVARVRVAPPGYSVKGARTLGSLRYCSATLDPYSYSGAGTSETTSDGVTLAVAGGEEGVSLVLLGMIDWCALGAREG
jgi:hypothetical protein